MSLELLLCKCVYLQAHKALLDFCPLSKTRGLRGDPREDQSVGLHLAQISRQLGFAKIARYMRSMNSPNLGPSSLPNLPPPKLTQWDSLPHRDK